MSGRVSSGRDVARTLRDDLLADIIDALDIIVQGEEYVLPDGSVYKFKTSPKSNTLWRVDPFDGTDLPANVLFDQDSEAEDNGTRVKHKLNISVKHIVSSTTATSEQLKLGIMDVLRVLQFIEADLVKKYHLPYGLRLVSTSIGMESEASNNGAMEAMFMVQYNTERYSL